MRERIRYELLCGSTIREELLALAALRLAVFREWPYLYDGTLDYERQYLETYARCADSLAVLVWDGAHCVGATTALPLAETDPAMRKPFEERGLAIDTTFYFGESVVLASHRGLGIGVRFFELREAAAKKLGLSRCTFCAVERAADHPQRPADYVGNEAFWSKRGYTRQPELSCQFEWLDLGEASPRAHTLRYWWRDL